MMISCTLLQLAMAFSCHVRKTSHTFSVAWGSLLRRSIFVSCASLRVRKRRWHCWVSPSTLTPQFTCFSASFQVCSTPRQMTNRSLASLTTVATTPLHSPKRSGKASSFHCTTSFSKRPRSPSSMAVCSGGSSRSVCMMVSVISLSFCSCASVCLRPSAKVWSAAAFSLAMRRSHSDRVSAAFWAIALSSSLIFLSHSSRNSLTSLLISAFSCAMR
mmetsp:Transcript_75190/g.161056  ORF Transcript_75190/g.161056 Transcript_75190/m.161056 type:complete len:216 (+) Transcript_75190:895-1542(+)